MSCGRSARLTVTLAVLLALSGLGAGSAPGTDADPATRIAYHRARVGGAGTYPHRARLGLAYLARARETGSAEDLGRAERHLRRSLAYQRNFEALLGLAALESARHRFRDALAYVEEAVAAAPASIEARGLLFEAHLALGHLESAAAEVERMLAPGPSFDALARQATLLGARGDPAGALVSMARACDQARASRQPAGSRAWCAAMRGELLLVARCDPQAAERAYQEALELRPGLRLAREHLAELRVEQGRVDEAFGLYEALLRERDDAPQRLALAALAERLERPRRAKRERRRALDALSRSVAAGSREHVRDYALALLEPGDAESTTRALALAREEWADRRDGMTAELLARALLQAGEPSEAGLVVDEALGAGWRDRGLVHAAAAAMLALGRADEARRIAEWAQPCGP